jgi:hypothetical protein
MNNLRLDNPVVWGIIFISFGLTWFIITMIIFLKGRAFNFWILFYAPYQYYSKYNSTIGQWFYNKTTNQYWFWINNLLQFGIALKLISYGFKFFLI